MLYNMCQYNALCLNCMGAQCITHCRTLKTASMKLEIQKLRPILDYSEKLVNSKAQSVFPLATKFSKKIFFSLATECSYFHLQQNLLLVETQNALPFDQLTAFVKRLNPNLNKQCYAKVVSFLLSILSRGGVLEDVPHEAQRQHYFLTW